MFHRSIFTAGVLFSFLLLLAGAMTASGDPLYAAPSNPKCAAGLRSMLAANPAGEFRVWVFFTDKGFRDEATFRSKKESFERHLDPHALKRRLKVRPRNDVVSFLDLPVEPKYITELKARGAKILTETEWLNGVCIEATGQTILSFEGLPFVREMKPEAVDHRPNEAVAQRTWEKAGTLSPEALDYGPSDLQLRQVNVTGLHQVGYTGAGVRLAILDTGFDRWHETLKRVRVFKEWDFMYWDDSTSFDPEQDTVWGDPTSKDIRTQTQHGTAMLSILGGFSYGRLIGSAFGADFLLAKTERNKSSQEPDAKQDEYRWVEGMRWADTSGADIVSSSLGYATFVDSPSYQYPDMNGQTAISSRIASIAADSFGILVVNAIGNVHDNQNWLLAPSDAFDIVAVGGCSLDGSWWSKSCLGPTADGRTKPEVAALGYATFMANNRPDSTGRCDSLEYRSGTSGATAVIAGLAALLLEAHTDSLNPSRSWGPRQVREALMMTASQASAPDYKLGWGIPDGVKALNYSPPVKPPREDKDALLDPYPNPYEPAKGLLRLPFYLTKGGDVWIYIYTSSGELVRQMSVGTNLLPGRYDSGSLVPMWDGKNEGRKSVASGTYLCLLKSGFGHDVKKVLVVR